MHFMLLGRMYKDQDIVQVDENEKVDKVPEHVNDQGMEYCWCIGQYRPDSHSG